MARVITRLNVGGPSHHVRILCARMTSFQSTLYAGVPEPGEGSLEADAVAEGVRVVRVPGLRRPPRPLSDLRALWVLYREFRRQRPDIVATHMAKAGTLGRLAAILARVPIRVHTFHGHVLEGYFGGFVNRLFTAIERWLAARTTLFIAISPRIGGDIQRLLGVDPGRIRVVRLGLDLDAVTGGEGSRFRAAVGIPAGAPLVAIVGRLAPIKNLKLFVDAAAVIAAQMPDAHFAIVGDGEERAAVAAWVESAGLAGRTHITGWRRDLADVYAAADCLVCCSRNEGTPVAVIEAGAAGRVAVCTDVGGMRDVVEDGRNGLIVAATPSALASAVAGLLTDTERRARMQAAAHEMALARYGADRLVLEVSAIYNAILPTALGDRPA